MLNFYLDWLNRHQFHGIRPGLIRIITILKRLNNPHLRYPTIHLAGTNGKGSTSAILSSLFTKHGFKTGLYTSPHLFRLNERFRINDSDISDEELLEMLKILYQITKGEKITYFELTTALAFLYFAEKGVDIAVIETGMGGRLDATNVIRPLLSIITTIGFDHTKYLGSTLGKIAFEKAGIIKRSRPVVVGNLSKEALEVVLDRAKTLKSRSYVFNRDFGISENKGKWNYWGEREYQNLELSLEGLYQGHNLALALKSMEECENLRFLKIKEDKLREALRSVRWEARFKQIHSKGKIWLLDGAHNPEGIRALRDSLVWKNFMPFLLIFAASNEDGDKPIKEMLLELIPLASEVILCEFVSPRKVVTLEEWQKILKNEPFLEKVTFCQNPEEALYSVLNSPFSKILITGSLYFLGEVLKTGKKIGLWD
ncbi:MAG: bifunctional folylpolyglutamate synthase/dihydrofolate synthase [Caldimicrobium sp.]|nr:bifunctional folylpolyglutamate synthase/dihydrofolate synthase [Caldimicrobium sp.]MCX7873778.1 bifunctional folylpolyglutamate synthase/dihydrofolate synthase [Caldimicrobium sp.]MDW8095005.1 folylpolyglutamate synthase/dihydrofolate synthase family protein [Caldimicrobium sp.]